MTVNTEKLEDGRYDIVLARPEKRNALNTEAISMLRAAAEALSVSEDARCIVLRGEGPVFSAGADVAEMRVLSSETARVFIDGLRAAIDAVFRIPVPVICGIQGACMGGALELAAACDHRIAERETVFTMPEVQVGIPSVIQAALLPGLMGRSRAGWFMLSGEVINADTAYDWGFVDRVTDLGGLTAAIDQAVAHVIRAAPNAVRTQKALLRDWETKSVQAAIADSVPVFAQSFETDEPATYLSKAINHKNE